MFIESWIAKFKNTLWAYFLPMFVAGDAKSGKTYNYYGVYFSDVNQGKYQLANVINRNVILEKWHPEQHSYIEKINFRINDIESMNVEIIHWRKHGPLRFDSIVLFAVSYFTRFAYVKNLITRVKNRVLSPFSHHQEMKGLERIMLLHMLVNEYVQQSPEKTHSGVTTDEVIDLLYGTLWYQHIKNETFRRKIFLLLQSLTITEDLKLSEGKYYIQGKAISTIVSWEADERRNKQQLKTQQNINRLMLIITASTLMITLAILAQAGIVNLHHLWAYLSQLKPVRVLFKLL